MNQAIFQPNQAIFHTLWETKSLSSEPCLVLDQAGSDYIIKKWMKLTFVFGKRFDSYRLTKVQKTASIEHRLTHFFLFTFPAYTVHIANFTFSFKFQFTIFPPLCILQFIIYSYFKLLSNFFLSSSLTIL
jgi:hypothetical protein